MSLGAILFRLCALAVLAVLALPVASATAYAHGGHGPIAMSSVPGEMAPFMDAGARLQATMAQVEAPSQSADACCCAGPGCCAASMHCRPAVALLASYPDNGMRRQGVPIVRAEHAAGIVPDRPAEPPNSVLRQR